VFCPGCRCEFRSGFTRCVSCDLDLVEDLARAAAPTAPRPHEAAETAAPVRLADYCGFLSLDEARHAREALRQARIRAEIAIRDAPSPGAGEPAAEEFWLRVDVAAFGEVVKRLGFDPAESSGAEEVACARCGHHVTAGEAFCPECGTRIEGD
jgi:hypothetical protein